MNGMIANKDILSLNFYNYGQAFTGSFQGMRYRIVKQEERKNEAGEVTVSAGLNVTVWPEPFSFERTEDKLKVSRLFPFSEEGKQQAVDWLNASYTSGKWQPGFRASDLSG